MILGETGGIMGELIFDEIFEPAIIDEAVSYLESRKDSCGIDGILLSELREYWLINGNDILEMLRRERYTPGIIRIIEIVNYKGKKRKIALYNSLDRMILRCLSQKIQTCYDEVLSDHCYAYRNGYGVEAAVSKVSDHLEEGFLWTVKTDIDHYFDSIDLKRMEECVDNTIDDVRIRNLVKKYLRVEVEENGMIRRKTRGLLQGSPLSPFLSNLYLTSFDNLMSGQGMRFCRFGDDIIFHFDESEKAEKHLEGIRALLKEEYGLDLNKEKSGVFEGIHQKYLGYRFRKDKKSGKILASRKVKKPDVTYFKWNRDAIQKVDRNYHIVNDGILTKQDYNLLFDNEEGKRYIPVETARAINIYSNVIFSADFFRFMGQKNLDVNIFDRYGNFVGYFSPANNGYKGRTMLLQAAFYNDEKRRLVVAKALEIGAMHNIRSNLRYYAKRKPNERLTEAIKKLSSVITEMNICKDIQGLMLAEGRGRESYYSVLNEIITNPDFMYKGRTRRPPKDPLNALISFGNVYMYNRVATEIHKTSLDIRIGIIHSTNTRSQTLNLDIAEIFKPLIIDRTIFTLINKRMIDPKEHFERVEDEGIYLNAAGKRLYINELDEKIYTKVTTTNEPKSYDTRIREEVSKIFRAIVYGEKYKPYKYQ